MRYFSLILRRLRNNVTFTLLNILGLALGITTFLLITLYVTDEQSFDRYNINADRLVRINTDIRLNGEFTAFAIAAPPVAATLKKNYPEVEATTRLLPEHDIRFRKGDEEVQEPAVARCDSNFFELFTLPFLEGNAHDALRHAHSIVITESAARRYFNTPNAVGRTLLWLDDKPLSYTVTGVIRDIPVQSHFHFDFFVPMQFEPIAKNNNFYSLYPIATYALLRSKNDFAGFDKKLDAFMRTWGKDYLEYEKGGLYAHLSAIRLTDIHLRSDRTDELAVNSSIQYVYIFSAIALLVLIIACINYMNLSTAHSADRAREIGVRKVLGSSRRQLIFRFLTESFLVTLAAAVLAFALTLLLLPWFNQLTGKKLSLFGWFIPSVLLLATIVGLLSGAYPAFFLSRFQPVDVLKGRLAGGFRNGRLRNMLVTFQFTISVILVVGVVVVGSQLSYMQKRDIGFTRSQVLVVKGLNALAHPDILKKEVQTLPGVTEATMSAFLPTGEKRWHNWGKAEGQKDALQTELWEVDEDYIPTMEMHLVKGRNFRKDLATDSGSIIINETAARMFGLAGAPLNKTIEYPSFWRPSKFRVIGVVRDFNFNSMRTAVTPLVMVLWPDDNPSLSIRITAGNIPAVLQQVKNKWEHLVPHRRFEYSFMDDDFDALYHSEQRMGKVVIVLAGLAIFIACLGLFGLAAYAAEQRNKEISIRKVLGAGAPSILALLSRDFLRLIALAVAIATPLSWLVLQRWLDSFAYRTTISVWAFVLAAALITGIAFITTFYQSFKAAIRNPILALRAE